MGISRGSGRRARRIRVLVPVLAAALAAGACDDDVTAPDAEYVAGQLTVDAASDSAYVVLSDEATFVPDDGDVGFWATAVFLRQGDTPVLALCLCQNAAASDEQVLAMTPDSEKADFDAVTAADVPPASDPRWSATTFDTNRWYRYDIDPAQPHHIHPTFDVYLIRKGSSVHKLQIVNYYDAANDPRHITFRYQRLTE